LHLYAKVNGKEFILAYFEKNKVHIALLLIPILDWASIPWFVFPLGAKGRVWNQRKRRNSP